MKRINLSKKKLIFGMILAIVFAGGFIAAYFGLKLSKIFVKTPPSPAPVQTATDNQVNFGQGAAVTDIASQKGVYNSVLLGYGGAGHDGSLLTDSIIVIHVDSNKKTAALISIPRDLWVNGGHKINAEASINGFANEGGVIKNVTGLPVDYFVAADFSGFTKLIDNLGGIAVNVPKTFDDPYYPIAGLENDMCGKSPDEIATLKSQYSGTALEEQFTCRFEHLHFDKGTTNLDGATALKFVRSRHGDSDFGRSERQFAVLKGVLAKLISLHAFDKANSTLDTLVAMVKTNLNAGAIKAILEVVGDTGQYKITEIHLTTENFLMDSKSSDGAYILVPKAGMFDFSAIKSYISQNI